MNISAYQFIQERQLWKIEELFLPMMMRFKEKGANAVLGICFDLRDTVKPMLMVMAVV